MKTRVHPTLLLEVKKVSRGGGDKSKIIIITQSVVTNMNEGFDKIRIREIKS